VVVLVLQRVCLALVVLFVLPSMIVAQVRYRTQDPGRWQPWEFTAASSARADFGASAAEVKLFEARLLELDAIIRRAPIVAAPIGFAAGAYGHLAGIPAAAPGRPGARAVPLAGGYSLGAYALFEYDRDGKTVREEGIATELLHFEINQIDRGIYAAERPVEWEGELVEGFLQPVEKPGTAGLTRWNDVFVLKKNPQPLWVPMLLGEAIEPVVAVRRAALAQLQKAFDTAQAEFTQWQNPEARAARRAEWQKAAGMMPDGAGFLKNMEDSERQVEAVKRDMLAPQGSESRSLADSQASLQDAEGALAVLSTEQRSTPACYDTGPPSIAGRFRPAAGAPASCRPLVRPNWAYFDATLPRAAPQVVMLSLFDRCLTPESLANTVPAGCTINRKVVEQLDWDAVRTWLDR
jgi:hypothetical protein